MNPRNWPDRLLYSNINIFPKFLKKFIGTKIVTLTFFHSQRLILACQVDMLKIYHTELHIKFLL